MDDNNLRGQIRDACKQSKVKQEDERRAQKDNFTKNKEFNSKDGEMGNTTGRSNEISLTSRVETKT